MSVAENAFCFLNKPTSALIFPHEYSENNGAEKQRENKQLL